MILANSRRYAPAFGSPADHKGGWLLAFSENKLLLKKPGNGCSLPDREELIAFADKEKTNYFGEFDGIPCFCCRFESPPQLPDGFEFAGIMELTQLTGDPELFILAGTANQLLRWSEINRYCGRCGHEMTDKAEERAKICPTCGNVVYPRISPATITAVFRGDEILLAHNRNFRGEVHSLIAGFVEPGETLEQCVEREIQEEVGISVKNIRYFGSQPWPFPDSLMIAFTAEYESGEITVDKNEITKAAWFRAENLPEIPSTDSVAGKIIRWYRDRNS